MWCGFCQKDKPISNDDIKVKIHSVPICSDCLRKYYPNGDKTFKAGGNDRKKTFFDSESGHVFKERLYLDFMRSRTRETEYDMLLHDEQIFQTNIRLSKLKSAEFPEAYVRDIEYFESQLHRVRACIKILDPKGPFSHGTPA